MLEKWKQWAIKLNFRKAVILFLITGFALALASSVMAYQNFRGRISGWEQFAETDREHGRKEKEFSKGHQSGSAGWGHDGDFKERKEGDWEEMGEKLHLSAGDIALVAGCGIIGMVLGVWYWALVLAAVYRKSYRMGVNTTLWVLAALVFNLAALIVLYLYAMLKGTCTDCGRVREGSGKFCVRCGTLLKKECPQCRQATGISSAYCSNCGKKLGEVEG